MSSLENIIESLYFSASRPISESEIVKILNDSNYYYTITTEYSNGTITNNHTSNITLTNWT